MRLLVALALLLLPLAAAAAQTAPLYSMEGRVEAASLRPGESTVVRIEVARLCPNQALVLQAREAKMAYSTPPGLTMAGPASVAFPQQVCAQEPRHVQAVEATLSAAADAGAGLKVFSVALEVPAAPPVEEASHEQVDLGVTIVRPAGSDVTPDGSRPPRAAPGPAPGMAVAAILLAAALAARRR